MSHAPLGCAFPFKFSPSVHFFLYTAPSCTIFYFPSLILQIRTSPTITLRLFFSSIQNKVSTTPPSYYTLILTDMHIQLHTSQRPPTYLPSPSHRTCMRVCYPTSPGRSYLPSSYHTSNHAWLCQSYSYLYSHQFAGRG